MRKSGRYRSSRNIFAMDIILFYNPYYVRIENIVNTIIEVELPQLRELDLGNIRKVQSLMGILSSNVPYALDTVKLAKMAEISRTTLLQYL